MPTMEKSRTSPLVIAGVSTIVLLLILLVSRSFLRDKVQVRVSPVTRENLVSSVSTNGKVEPIEYFQAHAVAPGVVQKVLVEVGDHVRTGDLLLQMDDADARARIATSTATLRGAEATASDQRSGGTQEERIMSAGDLARQQQEQQQAERSLTALRTLQARGAASSGEVAAAQDRLTAAENALHLTQQRSSSRYSESDRTRAAAQIADAHAGLAAAQAAYASANIRAPFAGTVYSVPVNAYDFVAAGEDLLDLADLTHIQVRAYFDEPEIGRLARGQAVSIVWEGRPNQTWHGHIDRAPSTVITYGTRNVGECFINVDDSTGDLLPNTNVTVKVTTSQRFHVLTVPREAVHTDSGVNFVYRVVNHRLVRTPVQIGIFDDTREEITSGLSEKDTVALNATSNRDLANGLEVNAVE